MNMLAVSLLLLPVLAAFALLYGPAVHASLNPGNEIMTASNYTFQLDTFSAAGAIVGRRRPRRPGEHYGQVEL